MTPERFRERFPIFERKTFLNSCSKGALCRKGVIVSSRGPGLRISFHYYNIPEDVDTVLRVLDRHAALLVKRNQGG